MSTQGLSNLPANPDLYAACTASGRFKLLKNESPDLQKKVFQQWIENTADLQLALNRFSKTTKIDLEKQRDWDDVFKQVAKDLQKRSKEELGCVDYHTYRWANPKPIQIDREEQLFTKLLRCLSPGPYYPSE